MKLAQSDVRGMVRLLGEVVALPGGHAVKKRFLMEGLCNLIDADAWMWGLSFQHDAAQPPAYVSLMNGGLSKQALANFVAVLEHPAMAALTSKFFAQVEKSGAHLTQLILLC